MSTIGKLGIENCTCVLKHIGHRSSLRRGTPPRGAAWDLYVLPGASLVEYGHISPKCSAQRTGSRAPTEPHFSSRRGRTTPDPICSVALLDRWRSHMSKLYSVDTIGAPTLALAVQAAIRKQIDVEADDSVNTTDGGLS